MNRLWKNSLPFVLLISSTLLLSCLKEEEAGAADLSLAAEISTFTSMRLIEQSRLADPLLTHHLHRAGNGSNFGPCEIDRADLDVNNPAQITCWLDVEELDLFFFGVDFKFELPANSCDFFVFRPYWFYQYPVGRTDGVLEVFIPELDENERDLCTNTCSYIDSNGASQNVLCNTLISDSTAAEPNFFFNHSQTGEGAPNCDEGRIFTYTYEFEHIGGGNCTAGDTPPQVSDGGGDFGGCWTSPGDPSNAGSVASNVIDPEGGEEAVELPFFPTNLQNFPIDVITLAANGISREYEYEAPIRLGFSSNLILANYTHRAGAGGVTSVPVVAEDSSFGFPNSQQYYVPQRLFDYAERGRDSNNLNSSPGTANPTTITQRHDPFWKPRGSATTPNPFYEFICADRAYEIKGRILLQIRDINTAFDRNDQVNFPLFNAIISNPALDFMDNGGNQISPVLHPLNDYPDWDDMVSPLVPSNADLGEGSKVLGVFPNPIFVHPEGGI